MKHAKREKRRRRILERLTGQRYRPGHLIKMHDGFYRIRRGKIVRIPDEWVGRPVEMCGKPRRWREFKKSRTRPIREKRKMRRREPMYYGRVPREKKDRKPIVNGFGYDAGPSKRMSHPRNRSPRHLGQRERRRLDEQDGLR